MKRIIIMGGTSGIGYQLSRRYIDKGWKVGIAGRKDQVLQELKALAPEQVETEPVDVTSADAPQRLLNLIERLGGMDIYFHSSGIGKQNSVLDPEIELNTLRTNGEGFTRMVITAFDYFRLKGSGHLAVISSIAGTKGLGPAPAYSATKCFQNCYIDALAQLAYTRKLDIQLTDIRPGFVDTPLLTKGDYPMLMDACKVADKIVRAVDRRKRVVIIDWRYRILVFFWRMIPQWLWERIPLKR